MSAINLPSGLQQLGLDLSADQQDKLLAFRDLLLKWNKTYNLTALRDPEQAVSHHLLDSLAILPHIGTDPLLDVGSGGGLPGIPLAIARPELSISMVDTVQKKATFLQQAAIQLGLNNVVAHHARVEQMTGQYAQISSPCSGWRASTSARTSVWERPRSSSSLTATVITSEVNLPSSTGSGINSA